MKSGPKRPLVITIDAEAQPSRSGRAPLDHLIHGQTGQDEHWGLWRILDIADEHGAVVTVFLDYAEVDLWGEGVLDVAREVRRRGHDLQLHLHPEFLSPARFEARGLPPAHAVAGMSRAQADVAACELLSLHDRVVSDAPLAFRGGGYHMNATLLAALRAEGVTIDSSFVPARHMAAAPDLPGNPARPFLWQTGIAELPVGTLPSFRNLDYPKSYNFNATFLLREGAKGRDAADAARRHAEFGDSFWTRAGEDAPLVLVMHSWSLLRRGEDGRFGEGSPLAAETLDLMLGHATREGAVRCVSDVASTLDTAALPITSLVGTT